MSDSSEGRSYVRRRRRSAPRAAETNYFIHLIFYERKFRMALVALVSAVLVGIALAPKIWVSSPEHIDETIRISGLDLLQAWNLKRTARQQVAAGNSEDAITSWISAVGNNPADLEAVRGLLGTLASRPKMDRAYLGTAVGQSRWLLKISLTNASDVALCTEVYRHYELYPQILALATGPVERLDPATVENLLIALFETGRMDNFGQTWSQDSSRQSGRPLASLYHAAWAAGWGPVSGISSGRSTLDTTAGGTGPLARTARRLQLTLHASRFDLASYEAVLGRIRDDHDARVQDEVRFWLLLEQSGRKDRAIELAKQHTLPAETPTEADLLIQAWRRLGMTDIAIEFARKQLSNFSYHPGLWIALAGLLMETRNWDELRALALEMRAGRLRETYQGWTQYLEGVVDHHRNRLVDVTNQFQAAITNQIQDPLLAFNAAGEMRRLGYPVQATALLKTVQNRFPDNAVFWSFLQRSAFEARQGDVILEASEQLYQLQRTNAVAANNFAAALLTQRTRPADALKVTETLFQRYSRNPAVRINHGTALIRNGRAEEALPVLKGLAGMEMSESEQTFAAMAWFEYHDARSEPGPALEAAAKVERRFLFRDQLEGFAARVATLEGRPAKATD